MQNFRTLGEPLLWEIRWRLFLLIFFFFWWEVKSSQLPVLDLSGSLTTNKQTNKVSRTCTESGNSIQPNWFTHVSGRTTKFCNLWSIYIWTWTDEALLSVSEHYLSVIMTKFYDRREVNKKWNPELNSNFLHFRPIIARYQENRLLSLLEVELWGSGYQSCHEERCDSDLQVQAWHRGPERYQEELKDHRAIPSRDARCPSSALWGLDFPGLQGRTFLKRSTVMARHCGLSRGTAPEHTMSKVTTKHKTL